MLLSYVALIYAVFILYLMIVTSAYYLKVREPVEIKAEVQKLRTSISDAFKRPR
jgi:CHASE3 domain sensor protein